MSETSKHHLYKGNIKEFKRIIKFIPDEIMEKLNEEDKLNDLAKGVKDTIGDNLSRFPRVCNETCEIIDSCPFAMNDAMPTGNSCPLECHLTEAMMSGLIAELKLDRSSLTASDYITLTSIVINHVLGSFRMYGMISTEGIMTTGTSRIGGEMVEMDVVNPVLEQMVNLSQLNQKLLKSLHLTRIDRARHAPIKEIEKEDDRLDPNDLIEGLQEAGIDMREISNVVRKLQNDNKKKSQPKSETDGES